MTRMARGSFMTMAIAAALTTTSAAGIGVAQEVGARRSGQGITSPKWRQTVE